MTFEEALEERRLLTQAADNGRCATFTISDYEPGDGYRYFVSVSPLFGKQALHFGAAPNGGSAIVTVVRGIDLSQAATCVLRFDNKAYLAPSYFEEKTGIKQDNNRFAALYHIAAYLCDRETGFIPVAFANNWQNALEPTAQNLKRLADFVV